MRPDPYRITAGEMIIAQTVYLLSEGHLLLRRVAYQLGVGHCPGCPRKRGQGHKMDCGWVR